MKYTKNNFKNTTHNDEFNLLLYLVKKQLNL